ncbi:hypothetical protein [Kitasatospora sp. NPDC096204]|uniref:hypothetical protein n=1 Tax=Kitasatospora sp. NPDC096204 TaxID=3364094 RepID=UPI00381491E5
MLALIRSGAEQEAKRPTAQATRTAAGEGNRVSSGLSRQIPSAWVVCDALFKDSSFRRPSRARGWNLNQRNEHVAALGGDPTPPGQEDSTLAKVKNGLGFLLAAFAALLNVLGLQSSELSSVLRNEPHEAAVVAALLAGALAAAAASIFIPNTRRIPSYWAPVTLACLVALAAAVISTISIPGVSSETSKELAGIAAGGLIVIVTTSVLVARKLWKTKGLGEPEVSLTSILLLCSVVLLSLAAFAAGRVEARSQVDSTHPQFSAVIKQAGSLSFVSITLGASKLRDEEQVGILVRGVPRTMDLAARCRNSVRVDTCLIGHVCTYKDDPCEIIASGPLKPDATGSIKVTVEAPFQLSSYQFLDVRATLCQIDPDSRNCRYGEKDAILFLRVPSEAQGVS